MKAVNSKLKLIVAERELRDRRRLGIRTIASESGASVSTVQRLINNTIKNVPLDDLGRLCGYFGVSVADILIYEETTHKAE